MIGVQPIDLGPEERIAEIGFDRVPERVAALDRVRRRDARSASAPERVQESAEASGSDRNAASGDAANAARA